MVKMILIISTILTMGSLYMTYAGVGLQEVESIETQTSSVRSSSHSSYGGSSYSGGYSLGK